MPREMRRGCDSDAKIGDAKGGDGDAKGDAKKVGR